MSLSSEIQNLIYDIDAMIDASFGDTEVLEDKRRMLNAALLRQAAIEVRAATQDYLNAKQCLDEAKACLASATESLQKKQEFIEKVAKVVEAVGRLLT
jgi:hypothetical protein